MRCWSTSWTGLDGRWFTASPASRNCNRSASSSLLSQGLDTDESNPASKLLMHILAAVAQFERELIRERVSAGIRTAKANGTRSGQPIGRPRVIVDRQRVIQLRLAGASWATIGKALEVPSTTARRAYREPAPLPKTCVRETGESSRKQRAAG